jgi:REP element-mobilizing transposase RayT
MARKRRLSRVGYYHVLNRGVAKGRIFLDERDYRKFLVIIEEASTEYGFEIYSFCLMPNHYHLLVETKEENLSRFMQKIGSRYTVYFNKKYNRVGPLWQGRFKAYFIYTERKLHTLVRYIEFNPIKAGITREIGGYRWAMSSAVPAVIDELSMLNYELLHTVSLDTQLSKEELSQIDALYRSKPDSREGDHEEAQKGTPGSWSSAWSRAWEKAQARETGYAPDLPSLSSYFEPGEEALEEEALEEEALGEEALEEEALEEEALGEEALGEEALEEEALEEEALGEEALGEEAPGEESLGEGQTGPQPPVARTSEARGDSTKGGRAKAAGTRPSNAKAKAAGTRPSNAKAAGTRPSNAEAVDAAIVRAVRDGHRAVDVARYLGLSRAAISKRSRNFARKEKLFEKLRQKGLFWSYRKDLKYQDIVAAGDTGGSLLIEQTLKYADFDDIKLCFELFGKRAVKKVWEQKMKSDGRFIKTNLMLARLFFGMDVESGYFKKAVKVNGRLEKLRMRAS